MYTITMSDEPIAIGASWEPAVTVSPIVATRKKVPMNSVRYLRMAAPLSAGAPQPARRIRGRARRGKGGALVDKIVRPGQVARASVPRSSVRRAQRQTLIPGIESNG